MAFPRKLLNDGEDIVLDLRPHWIALGRPFLAVVASLALAVVALIVGNVPFEGLALILIVVAMVYFGSHLLGWSRTMFVVTTDRIISRRGVLTKSGIEIPLERINTVFFNQRFIERLLGAGDLALESASERGTQTFSNIRKPDQVQREIYVQMEANENRKFDRARGAGPVASLSVAEQLEKLHDLLTKGALTQEQYEVERARILGS